MRKNAFVAEVSSLIPQSSLYSNLRRSSWIWEIKTSKKMQWRIQNFGIWGRETLKSSRQRAEML